MALQALGAAAERGNRPLAHFVGIERSGQGEAAALLLRAGLVGGLRRGCRADCAAGTAADLARTFIFLGFDGDAWRLDGRRSTRGRRRGLGSRGGLCRRLGFTKTALGFLFGPALGFFFHTMPVILGLAAGFSGLAFGLFDALAAGAALGFLFG